jgi:hypothetical protein
MAFAAFGPGILIATRTDLTTPVAINVGFVQEFSLDLAGNTKELYGQNQYPLVAARSTIKATGKFKNAEISGLAWNNAFFGQPTPSPNGFTSGGLTWNIDSTYSIGSTTALTTTVLNSSLFDADLGVFYSTKNLPMQRVAAGAEAAGKYSVSAVGVYTFNASDTLLQIKITYTTTNSAATAQSLIITNQPIGFTPTFQLDYYTSLNQPAAKPFAIRVYSCIASKLGLAFKLEDFMMPEFEFSFFANSSNQIMDMILPDIS